MDRRSLASYLFCVMMSLLNVQTSVASDFSVKTSKDGSFQVLVTGDTWLGSGATSFQFDTLHHSTADGTLKLASPPFEDSGLDSIGQWTGVTFQYAASRSFTTMMTSVKTYDDVNVAVFSQKYFNGANKTSVGNKESTISAFPTFSLNPSDGDLGYLAYCGLFIGHEDLRIGKLDSSMKPLPSGLSGTGPVLLFDRNDSVLLISPMNNFMAASYQYNKDRSLSYGIMGDVDTVTPGYQLDTIVYYGNRGINQAFEDWGSLMMKLYNRDSSSRHMDPTNNYLGFWTDNGAYYYHHTEPHLNYEKTIQLQTVYAQSQGIPYRYLQLDDWFYPIAGTGYGATVTWDAMTSVFPDGLVAVYNFTQKPIHAHNRYWSSKTTYAKQNGGKFNFLMDGENAIPDDQSFWDYLFVTAKQWGLTVYEQDWLNWQVEHIKWLHSDLTLSTRWLKQMGDAASNNGIFLQYCMALPRQMLATLEIPSVSQIRVSIDYLLHMDQWKIGVTSMFSHALGVAPFKDNFWTQSVQPGNIYKKVEVNPSREAAVAILSTGPVGPSDRVSYSDITLIKQLHAANGLLLKPSKPATVIDDQILQQAFGGGVGPEGEVWTAYSDVTPFRFGIIFASELNGSYRIGPGQAKFGSEWKDLGNMVYSTNRTNGTVVSGAVFSAQSPLTLKGCNGSNLCLHYTSPILSLKSIRVYLAGEVTKMVPVSPQRISRMSVSSSDVQLTVEGSPGEKTVITFCSVARPSECQPITCIISMRKQSVLSLANQSCT